MFKHTEHQIKACWTYVFFFYYLLQGFSTQLSILCMSPLFNTPDSDPQLVRIDIEAILTSWGQRMSTSGFWTGCSNASLSMRGRSWLSAEWMGVNGVSPPEILFSHDVIFCCIQKGGLRKYTQLKIAFLSSLICSKNPFKTVMTSHNSRMLVCFGQQHPNL